jgi:hypothetical protein
MKELKAKLGVGSDDLVIDVGCAHYGLDMLALPKAYKPDRKTEERRKGGKKA